MEQSSYIALLGTNYFNNKYMQLAGKFKDTNPDQTTLEQSGQELSSLYIYMNQHFYWSFISILYLKSYNCSN